MTSRDQFEQAYAEDNGMTLLQVVEQRMASGSYSVPAMSRAWFWWQESRAAVVVELPPPYPMPEEPEFADDDSYMDAYHAAKGMRHACGKAIEAAGLKVAS